MTHDATVRERARELVEAGHCDGYVADTVQVTCETVRRWAIAGGWRPKKPELTPLAERRLWLLVGKGYSCSLVGKQLGIYPRKLRQLVEKRGLTFASHERSYALAQAANRDKWDVWKEGIDKLSEREERLNELVY